MRMNKILFFCVAIALVTSIMSCDSNKFKFGAQKRITIVCFWGFIWEWIGRHFLTVAGN